jgi:hypothetical protein
VVADLDRMAADLELESRAAELTDHPECWQ